MSMYGKFVRGRVYTRGEVNKLTQIDCSKDVLMTKQSDRAESDINLIMKKIEKGAMPPPLNGDHVYADISQYDGLAGAYEQIQKAEELFYEIPAPIREKFDNDPVKMMEFIADEKNYDKAVEYGIVTPKTPPATPATAVPTPA